MDLKTTCLIDMGEKKRYDQFAANCEGCGWLAEGEFPDGMPYMACRNYGTIMYERSDVQCNSWRTPAYVERFMEKNRKVEQARLKEAWTKQKKCLVAKQFKDDQIGYD